MAVAELTDVEILVLTPGDIVPHIDFSTFTYVRIDAADFRQLSWSEVWQAFNDTHPGRWAIEFFPPKARLVDDANAYHLWMAQPDWQPPCKMDMKSRYEN